MIVRASALAIALTLVAAAIGRAQSDLPPTGQRALVAWLRAGTYRSTYTPEPSVHPSAGPHGGNVRTWLSPTLVEDLRAARTPFRKGAAMVKELYFDGEEQAIGYAVMRKVRRRSGARGQGWYFFETFDGSTPVVRPGRGAGVCVGCHRAGNDYYLLAFQP
jgi:hypothetical protein